MTTPRIASLTALAASLLFVVLTITQANGLQTLPDASVPTAVCHMAEASLDCATGVQNASLLR